MRSQEFLHSVRDQALGLVPESLRQPQSRVVYGMLQLHYGEPRIHYEVWLVRKTGRIEIGLHFEGEREVNHAWAAQLAERVFEFQDALGPEADLEEWSPSWTRLHVTLPLGALDDRLCTDVAGRLAALLRLTAAQIAAVAPRLRQRAANGELRIVGEHRPHAYGDRVVRVADAPPGPPAPPFPGRRRRCPVYHRDIPQRPVRCRTRTTAAVLTGSRR